MYDSGWMRRKGRPRVSISDSESVAAKAPQVLRIIKELGIRNLGVRFVIVSSLSITYSTQNPCSTAISRGSFSPFVGMLVCTVSLQASECFFLLGDFKRGRWDRHQCTPLWLYPLRFTSRAMAQRPKMSPSLGVLNIFA